LEKRPGLLVLAPSVICVALWESNSKNLKLTESDTEWIEWEKRNLQAAVPGTTSFKDCLSKLDSQLQLHCHLTQESLSVVDLIVWSSLYFVSASEDGIEKGNTEAF
jgi:hypothetical protein